MNHYRNFVCLCLLFATSCASLAVDKTTAKVTLPDEVRKMVRSTVFVMDMCAAYYNGIDIELIEIEAGIDELEPQVVFSCGGLADSIKLLDGYKDDIPIELYHDLVTGVKLTVLLTYREALGSEMPSAPVAELSKNFDIDDYSKYYYLSTETYQGKKLPQKICHILERIEGTHSAQLTDDIIKTKLFCNR